MKLYKELFEEFDYQTSAVEILSSSIAKNRIAPSYLFVGPKGVGQKEVALRFLEGIAKQGSEINNIRKRIQNRNYPDLHYVEPTYLYQGKLINQSIAKDKELKNHIKPQIRIDQIIELKMFLNKKPIESNLSMIFLEDAELLNESAANALLKTMEEPINGVLVLTSSRPDRLLKTIKSRCQIINFKGFNNLLLKEKIMNYKSSERFATNQTELISISNGSPELLQNNLEFLEEIPESIWYKITNLPTEALDALFLAKEITETINSEEQICMINWMQQFYWLREKNILKVKRLEKLKIQLKSYVNSRIAWEVTLIELSYVK
ncbi:MULTISPECIES: hypothetical protein [unclassified Prochlorococcus]|uniref:hypothetical protein n=1 Tax=unclassified Prochlorococcus TaxID=2627481 RepID=UPI000533AB9C|nr:MULTISPECIES: hypothetical protein [unclassified Prochlorococcus]KGG16810.1 DNA polymerasee III delta prime subunit [Prochlorococcus sp. MIT 0602]KGG18216.1 DNA polymerasee III delta prime subunit [Prochlorococcus sp. MIT 0603]